MNQQPKREPISADQASHILNHLADKIEAVEGEVNAVLNKYQLPTHSVPQAFRARYLLMQVRDHLQVASELVER